MNSSSADNAARFVGRGNDRRLYVAHIGAVGEWPARIDEPRPHFIALIVMDAGPVDGDELRAFAERLIDQGMVYLFAWGPDCKRVHDVFDLARESRGETDDAFVATSWYEDEELDDALWDAVMASPADDYVETSGAVVAIVVDQPSWSKRVETAFTDFDSFNETIFAR